LNAVSKEGITKDCTQRVLTIQTTKRCLMAPTGMNRNENFERIVEMVWSENTV